MFSVFLKYIYPYISETIPNVKNVLSSILFLICLGVLPQSMNSTVVRNGYLFTALAGRMISSVLAFSSDISLSSLGRKVSPY